MTGKGMSSPTTNSTAYRSEARLALTNINATSWRKGAKTAERKLTVRHARRGDFLIDATSPPEVRLS